MSPKERIKLHIRRVRAELKTVASATTPESTCAARVLVNDLSLSGIGLFCASPVEQGIDVELVISAKQPITFKGKVVWCQEFYNQGHIVSDTKFSYRCGIKFSFKDAEEQTKLMQLYEAFAREILGDTAA